MTGLSCPLCGDRFDSLRPDDELPELAAFDEHLDGHILESPPAVIAALPAAAPLETFPLEAA